MPQANALIQASLIGEALENGPVGVFVVAEDLQHTAVNQYACDLLGYTRDELMELTGRDLSPGTDVDARMKETQRTGKLSGRSLLRRKDGTDVKVEFRVARTSVAGLEFFVSIVWPVGESTNGAPAKRRPSARARG